MKRAVFLLAMNFLFCIEYAQAAWVTFDKPGASHTFLTGVDGNNLVGYYYDDVDGDGNVTSHGFLYNMSSGTWTTFDAAGAEHTYICDIDGGNIVGWYRDVATAQSHGFVYDGTSWLILDKPGAGPWGTEVYGIDGSNIVGSFSDTSNNPHGFIYNSIEQSWTTLDYPGTTIYTRAPGISGNNIVIYYAIYGGGYHSGIYNGTDWTNIDKTGEIETRVYDIDGSNIVGWYQDSEGIRHGYLYNLEFATWTTLDTPFGAEPRGIDGSNVVGYYDDYSSGSLKYHGFVYTIPPLFKLTIQIEPDNVGINSISPEVGDHSSMALVNINANRFVNCPNVYAFDHWIGDVADPNSATTTIFMNSDKTITAVFIDDRTCGDECHPYPSSDVNKDCIVNLADVAMLASEWLYCTKPECD